MPSSSLISLVELVFFVGPSSSGSIFLGTGFGKSRLIWVMCIWMEIWVTVLFPNISSVRACVSFHSFMVYVALGFCEEKKGDFVHVKVNSYTSKLDVYSGSRVELNVVLV